MTEQVALEIFDDSNCVFSCARLKSGISNKKTDLTHSSMFDFVMADEIHG